MYLADIFTLSLNLAGICGLSLPCGFDGAGSAHRPATDRRRLCRDTLLQTAYAYEQATEWHTQKARAPRLSSAHPIGSATPGQHQIGTCYTQSQSFRYRSAIYRLTRNYRYVPLGPATRRRVKKQGGPSGITPVEGEPMSDRISRRVAAVPPSGIRKFFDIAATMQDVISLGIGEPDFVTPDVIRAAGIASLGAARPVTPPTPASSSCARRSSAKWAQLYGVDYDPRRRRWSPSAGRRRSTWR